MRDIAVRAGVSTKTVSNVLNDYPYLRPETRARVERAIADLGYRMNLPARHLRQGRTGIIGLAVPELSLAYWGEFADLVMAEAARRGLQVLIEPTRGERDRVLAVLNSPQRSMTDGLLFSPLGLEPDEGHLVDVGYPLVLLGERIFDAPVDHVTMSNVAAARAATRHLAEQGCRRIAAIGARHDEGMGSAVLRHRGYLAGLADAGIQPDPALVVEANPWTRATGSAAMAALLDSGVEVDGVFAMNDALAFGALHVLHTRHLAVPGAVKVIGFDDVDDAAYYSPPLSSVAPGTAVIARQAVDLLVRRIEGDESARAFVEVEFEVRARESSLGPAPQH